MVVCPECGERATMESYEAWTPAGGWKKTERISCMNVRPKQGEPCGKKTVLSETPLNKEGSPLMSTAPASTPSAPRKGERSKSSSSRSEQPTPAPAEEVADEEPVEDAQEVKDSLEQPDLEEAETEEAEEADPETGDAEAESEESSPSLDPGSRRFPKYSADQYRRLIELVEGGMTCPQASTEVGIQVNTAYGIIGKYRRSQRGQRPVAGRRPLLTLVPPRMSSATTSVARVDTPFKTSTLLTQLKNDGVASPGRLLSSPDLAAFFKLAPETQESLRLFHAMKSEVAEAEKWNDAGLTGHLIPS